MDNVSEQMHPEGNAGRERPDRTPRARKFRQAAIVYLHVGLVYEFAVFAFWRRGVISPERHVWLWLLVGALVVASVVWGLWRWQNAWFARTIWALHALRLPWLIEHAFFQTAPAQATMTVPASFYLAAIAVVLVNLWMLARAGWDV